MSIPDNVGLCQTASLLAKLTLCVFAILPDNSRVSDRLIKRSIDTV